MRAPSSECRGTPCVVARRLTIDLLTVEGPVVLGLGHPQGVPLHLLPFQGTR